MNKQELFDRMDDGRIEYADRMVYSREIPWEAHPVYPGVSLKTLIKLEETGGRFSCLLVKIGPGQEIGEHSHDSQWELHEVVYGNGKCIILEKEIAYESGVCAVIPDGLRHRVIAGQNGLFILAKFMPAL